MNDCPPFVVSYHRSRQGDHDAQQNQTHMVSNDPLMFTLTDWN